MQPVAAVPDTPAPPGAAAGAAPRSLLTPTDCALMLGLMAVGLLLRLRWWTGFGLGDDVNFRNAIVSIVDGGVLANAYGYRATWWLPTAVACRALGITETALILPITLASTLGIGVLYAFGNALWGRAGGVVAALLLIVHPLDFGWSTMFTNDVFQSLFAALCVLLFVRATDATDPTWRRRLFFFSALSLILAYHAKVAAVALVPALALIAWRRRARLLPEATTFVGFAILFFGLSALGSIALTGTPLGPYQTEKWLGGLTTVEAAKTHPLGWDALMTYPRMLFAPNHLGDMIYSLYPHLLVVFVLLGWPLGLRSSPDVWIWFLGVFLVMEFQVSRVDGIWASMFRNVRHSHAFVYPLVLLLAGYLCSLRARWPRIAHALLAVLLAFSAWTSVSAAAKMRESFADGRAAAAFVAGLPPKPIYSDLQLGYWVWALPGWPSASFHPLEVDSTRRRVQLAALRAGYVVTGGGREPYYGCFDCIPRADDLPPGRWRLLKEFPGPAHPTPWRQEPARVWEAVGQEP